LEAAGFAVELPRRSLCCGRPLYDWGMIAPARRLLDGVLRALRAPLEAGVPVVALEPSCASVFRDELRNLMPRDPTASRLREQTFLFAEFLNRHAPHLDLPRLERAAVAHGHCHQKALWGGMDEERALFRRMGVEAQVLDSGCCGMAGSFGFERGEKYRVSMRVGEHELFPTLRRTGEETLLVADGFSCREQIRQATPRRALHIAEVARLSLARHAVDPLSVSLPLPVPVLSPAPPAAVAMLAVAAAIGNAHVRRWGRVVTLGALGALGAALTGLAVRARARARARRRERQRGRESSGAASATSAKLEAAVNKQ
jgi:hypothetical protein